MYRIYADDTLIYDSTLEDYKIGKGQISLEINKSGSFVFSLYPEHFFYDQFVRLRTIITVYKDGWIVFRGRVLNDVTDYHNNKVLTCEGELGFLRDSVVRPFEFNGTPAEFFALWIENHNAQVDAFKRFKVGRITVSDKNDRIYRNSDQYEQTLDSLNSRTINADLGGYIFITHGEDGTDPIPTIHYLSDSEKIATQTIEFGVNLKDYVKTVSAEDIATAIIPYSKPNNNSGEAEALPLTIADINGGKDYVYSEAGVALYGWIFKTVEYKDVINAETLKENALEDLEKSILQNVSVELNAIDMHLLNRSIESFNLCDYIRVFSPPHSFDSTLLCSKQTLDLLKPSNDKVTLGFAYSAFTQTVNQTTVSNINKNISMIVNRVSKTESSISQQADEIELRVTRTEFDQEISDKANYADLTELGNRVTEAETTIKIIADGFSAQVTRTEFDSLGERVTDAEASITANTEAIALKVSEADYLEGMKLKADLEDLAAKADLDDLASKADLDDFEDLVDRVGKAETSITATTEAIELKADRTDLLNTFVQLDEPTAEHKGDRWVQTGARTWAEIKAFDWQTLKSGTWDAAMGYPLPNTYTWNGSEWILEGSLRDTEIALNYDVRIVECESSIVQQADEIKSKVSKTEYELDTATLKSRVSKAESTITQQADQIASKVNKTITDSDGKEYDAESTIIQTAEAVTTKLSATEYKEDQTALNKWKSDTEGSISDKLDATKYTEDQIALDDRLDTAEEEIGKRLLETQYTLEKTETAKAITAIFNEIGLDGDQTGVTKVDRTGIEVTHSNIGGKTTMNADGFRLYDANGNVIGGLMNINGESVSAVQRLANLLSTTFYLAVSPNIYGDGEHGVEFIIDGQNCGAITAQYLDGDVMGMRIRSEGGIAFSTPNETVSLGQIYANGVNVHYSGDDPGGNDGDIWLCPVEE